MSRAAVLLAVLCGAGACCVVDVVDLPDTGSTSNGTGGSGSSSGSTGGSTSGSPGVTCSPFDAGACTQVQACNYTLIACANGGGVPEGYCAALCGLAGSPLCDGGCASDDDCSLTASCVSGTCAPVVLSGGGFTCDADAGCLQLTPPHTGTPTCVCPEC